MPYIKTAFFNAGKLGDIQSHVNPVRIRVKCDGNLRVTLFNISNVNGVALSAGTMGVNATRSLNYLSNFRSEKTCIKIETTAIDEYFTISNIWAYVDYVLHINQKIETWTPIQNAQKTQKYFKEEVNDFRLFSMAYGKEGSNMNQLVEIHSVHESLNKKIIRIKKSSNKGDYILTATDNAVEFSDEDVKNLKSLISVKQYFQEKYAEKQENASVPLLDDVETEKVSSPVVTKGRTVRKTPPVKQIEEGTSDEEVDVDSAMEDIF